MEENSDLFANIDDSYDNENSGDCAAGMNMEMPTKGSEMKEISRLTMKTDLLLSDAKFVALTELSSKRNHLLKKDTVNKVDLPIYVCNVMYHRSLQREQNSRQKMTKPNQKKRKATESQLEKLKKLETYLELRKRILRSCNLNDAASTIIGFKVQEVNIVLHPKSTNNRENDKKATNFCYQFIKKLASNDEHKDETKGFTTEDAYFEILLPLIRNDSNSKESDKHTNQFPKTKGDRILPIWLLPELCEECSTKEFKECFPPWAIASRCLTLLTHKLIDGGIDENVKNALNVAILQLANVQERLTQNMIEKIRKNERKTNELNDTTHRVNVIRQRVLILNKLKQYEYKFNDLCDYLAAKVRKQADELKYTKQIETERAKVLAKCLARKAPTENNNVNISDRENNVNFDSGDDLFGDIEILSEERSSNEELRNEDVLADVDSRSPNCSNSGSLAYFKADEEITSLEDFPEDGWDSPKEQLQSEISSTLNGQVSHSKKRSRESEDDSCANKKRRIEK